MKLKDGAVIAGLHPVMKPAFTFADRLWAAHGEELVVTSGLDGVHSAGSWHYYGLALDFRTNFWEEPEARNVYNKLKKHLVEYDVVWHDTHIHVEVGNELAKRIGVLY